MQEINPTPVYNIIIITLLIVHPVYCHWIIFGQALIELGLDFLINKAFIVLEALLDVHFEFDDVVEDLFDFRVEFFTKGIRAECQLFEP